MIESTLLGRRAIFALSVAGLAFCAAVATLAAADFWAHHRADRTAGMNWRGYRGPVLGTPAPGEWRISMLGGSTVFGYGVRANEALPAQIGVVLQNRGEHVSVANLGFNSEGAYAFVSTLRDYRSVHPDVVVLYEGYNDLLPEAPNRLQRRHGSPVFRLTGYFPMLPIVLRDKADSLARRGSGGRVVFGVAADAVEGLGRQLGRLSERDSDALADSASTRWAAYCNAVTGAVAEARSQGASVLVVGQPYISDAHVEQQRALAAVLVRFAGDRRVAYFNAGQAISLRDNRLVFDGMHLTPEGNRSMAEVLVAPLLALAPPGRSR
jgi:lysophospholipase L1-like esterase